MNALPFIDRVRNVGPRWAILAAWFLGFAMLPASSGAPAAPGPVPVRAGTVRTLSGGTHQGQLAFTNQAVAILGSGGTPTTVPLDQIGEILFGDRSAGIGSEPPSTPTNSVALPHPTIPASTNSGWAGIAIGPGVAGQFQTEPDGWTAVANGDGLRGNSDSFYFVQRRVETGGQVMGQLRAFDGRHPEAMAGLMLRDNLGEAAAYAFLGQRAGGAVCLQYRQIAGGMTMRYTNFVQSLPVWLRMARQGGAISADVSADGRDWRPIGRVNVNLGQNARAGLAVMGGSETNRVTARVAEPAVGAAGMGYAPSRGYPRILLRGGSLLVSPVLAADESVVHLGGALRGSVVSVLNIARIEYLPVTSAWESHLEPDRPGLLLADGDFLDGSLRSIGTNTVTWNSLIFGFRRYSAGNEAAVVHLGRAEAEDAAFRVTLLDGSDLRARKLELGPRGVRAESPLLGALSVPLTELKAIRRGGHGK